MKPKPSPLTNKYLLRIVKLFVITVYFRGGYERRGEPRELQQREPEQRRCRKRATQRRDVTSHGGPVWASTRARYPFPWHVIVGSLLEESCREFPLGNAQIPDLRGDPTSPPPSVYACVSVRARVCMCVLPTRRIEDVLPFFLIVELFNTGDEKWTTKKRHARPGTPQTGIFVPVIVCPFIVRSFLLLFIDKNFCKIIFFQSCSLKNLIENS